MFAATLFDYNGVLIDDERVHLAAFQDTLRPLGIELTQEAYWERYLGFDDVGAFEAVLAEHGEAVTPQRVEELVRAKVPHYLARAAAGLEPFDGAAPLVRRCAGFGPVAVVSGALEAEIHLGLKALQVAELVRFIIPAEATGRSKPDPEGYLMGLARMREILHTDIQPREVLVVEDSLSGVEAAKAAGLTCVAVTHSYPEEQLLSREPDLIVRDLAELSLERLQALAASRQ